MKKKAYLISQILIYSCLFHTIYSQNTSNKASLDSATAYKLINEARALNDTSNFLLAEEKAQKAYLFFNLKPEYLKNNLVEAAFQMGRALNGQGKDSIARDFLEEALKLITTFQANGMVKEVTIRIELGKTLFQLGQYNEVIEVIIKAMEMQQKFLPENHIGFINSLRLLGLSYMKIGKYTQAVPYLEKLKVVAEHNPEESNDKYAEILNKLGQAYTYTGIYKEAILTLEHSLSILLSSAIIDQQILSRNYQFLGICYKNLKKFDLAISYYEKAFPIFVMINGKESRSVAFFYSEIGQVFLAKGDFVKALAYFLNGSATMIRIHEDKTGNYGWVCADIGKAHFAMGNFTSAIDWYLKAISIFRFELQYDNSDIGDFLLLLARAQTANLQFKEALESFDQNIIILKKLYNTDSSLLHYAHSGKADVYKKWFIETRKDSLLEASRYFYQLAEAEIKKQLQNENFVIGQKKIMADALPDFENAINAEKLYMNLKNQDSTAIERAWQYTETMHNFLLFTSTKESNARHFAGIPDEELKRDSLIQIQMTNLQKQRKSLLEDQELSLTDTLVLTQNAFLYAKEKEQNSLRNYFDKNYPEYSRLKYQLQSSSIEKTKQFLTPEQTLLEYFTGDSSIFIFVIQNKMTKLIELRVDFPLRDLVQNLLEGISTYHTSSQKNSELYKKTVYQYADAANKLYDKLIKPVSEFLTSELIIVPDGVLANLPFEALLSGVPKDLSNFKTYPYLVYHHSIQYAYSATMLHQMTEKQHLQISNSSLLAFAPFYDSDTASLAMRLNNDDAVRYGLSALPFSGDEVFHAKSHFNHFSEVLTGKKASKKKFQDLAPQFSILHLATHGKANHVDGEFSFLAFSADDKKTEYDLLSVGDLYSLILNADLVVLSACETAIGEQQRGEGIVSLASAFAYAGAKSIIASLWKVNDKSTMEVMDNFYKELKSGKPKNVALTNSKLLYLEKNPGQTAHPFYWAGFVGVGDMTAIKN